MLPTPPPLRSLTNVHAINAGLWGRTANISLTGSHGNWGKVFKETEPGQPGMPAYSVQVGFCSFRFACKQGGWGMGASAVSSCTGRHGWRRTCHR